MEASYRQVFPPSALLLPQIQFRGFLQVGLKQTELGRTAARINSIERKDERQSKRQCCKAARQEVQRHVVPPDTKFEVDKELWEALDICSDEDLEEIYQILYGKSFLPKLATPSTGI